MSHKVLLYIDFSTVKVCYDNYDRSIEYESDFFPSFDNFETFEKFPRKHTSADAWRYQNEKELDGHDVSGNFLGTLSLEFYR